MRKIAFITSLTAACLTVGFFVGQATSATDPLQLATEDKSGIGVYSSAGESPEAMARAAALKIQNYEPEDQEGGMGAPQKTLIDNDKIKVNLVAFKKGFIRPGGVKRRYDTLLVYVDPGRYTIVKRGNGEPVANPTPSKLAPGSSVFHHRDSVVSENRIDEDYRVLFIEMKNTKK
jgi:hypothetical protein